MPTRSLNVLPTNDKVEELRKSPTAKPVGDESVKNLNDETPIDRALDASLSDHQRVVKERIIEALRTVYDPELPVNLFDLGLIYKIDLAEVDGGQHVDIDMTLTAPACPVAGEMPGMVQRAVEPVDGVASCKVELVWSPRWDKSKMSEVALLELGLM
jgi:FeS assembly SUF system protein